MKSFYFVKSLKKLISSLRDVFIIDLFQIVIDHLGTKYMRRIDVGTYKVYDNPNLFYN